MRIKYKCINITEGIILAKDTIYKIRNHVCLIIVYNHPTSLRQDQSVVGATTNFA